MDQNSTRLKRAVIVRFALGIVVMGILLFLPAGTLAYPAGWIYLAVLFVPAAVAVAYFLRHDPGLLERRMKMREKESGQMTIVTLSSVLVFTGIITAALDHRFGWSDLPLSLVIAANGMVLLGYLTVFVTLRENRYATRVVEVGEGQQVITTGPYAVVRHPMYLGVLLMFFFTPLALGSAPALTFFLPLLPLIMLRILHEEQVLCRELPGYDGYRRTTPYRLIPFVW